MANITYDLKWQEAMTELNEQIHIEDHTLDVGEGEEPPAPPPQASMLEAFQHYACLYIKYVQIFSKLEQSYDQMVHPQKRIDVKQVLEIVMSRLVELKYELVKWNPPNPDVQMTPERHFPWEYVNLDDILVDLKLPPETLEVPVPRYFVEDATTDMKKRDRLIRGYMKLKLGVDDLYLPEESSDDDLLLDMFTVEEAIQVIQRNERGRQGKHRAYLVSELRKEEKRNRLYDPSVAASTSIGNGRSTNVQGSLASSSEDMDPEIAAANIQRMFRGFHSRAAAASERDDELVFIGMKMKPITINSSSGVGVGNNPGVTTSNASDSMGVSSVDDKDILRIRQQLNVAKIKRKTQQVEHREGYSNALVELREIVKEEEGPKMREEMLEERRQWFTDQMLNGVFPEDLSGFYEAKNQDLSNEESKDADSASLQADSKKKGKDTKKDSKKKDKDKGKGKGKKKKETEEEIPPEIPPTLTGPSALTTQMSKCVGQYEKVWLDRDETDNFQQQHDVELAKDVVRQPVEVEIRQQVDEMLILQLANIKAQLEASSGNGKKKKGAKGGKGKKGGKKKGGKGGKGKKGKGKKGKSLPGDKIAELKGRSTDTMLALLVEQRIVYLVPDTRVEEFIGAFNYLGTVYQNSDKRDRFGNWIPQDPSAAQLRQSCTVFGILPLGTPAVRTACSVRAADAAAKITESVEDVVKAPVTVWSLPRSILFYGPSGSGKTLMMRAIASTTGSMLINLSSSNLVGKFPGKTGPTKLIHMAFMIAKDPAFQPVIIYIDECETIFVGGGSGKKKSSSSSSDGPSRFRKDLLTYIGSLSPSDRVLIIGTTKDPSAGDTKDYRTFFDKYLYFPYPDYASRMMLWKHGIMSSLHDFVIKNADSNGRDSSTTNAVSFVFPDELDFSALAHISEGFTSGSICKAASNTMTKRRIQCMSKRPLHEREFISALSRCPATYTDDNEMFRAFTASVTGLKDVRDKLRKAAAAELDGADDKKKGGGKKKGKK